MLNETRVPAIQKAVVVIKEMSADEKIQEAARQRETMLHDKATALRFAREEGMKEGREAGIKEGERKGREAGIKEGERKGRESERANIISKMRSMGLDEELIKALSE